MLGVVSGREEKGSKIQNKKSMFPVSCPLFQFWDLDITQYFILGQNMGSSKTEVKTQ